jgi:hypothetical protein
MFYEFNQNNSGGKFEFDAKRGISHWVIIEAHSAEDANDKAEALGLYFDGVDRCMDCPCCGDRWHPAWKDEAYPVPTWYGSPITEAHWITNNSQKWMDGPEGFIHYKDGRIEPFWE